MRLKLKSENKISKLLAGLQMQWPKALVLGMICLSGCATPSGTCKVIPVKEYSQEFKTKLGNEMVSAGDATVEFVADSITLRDAVRACKGK